MTTLKLEEQILFNKFKWTKLHFDVCVLWISRLLYGRPIQSSFYIILLNNIVENYLQIVLLQKSNFSRVAIYYVLIDLQVYTKFNVFKN